MTLKVLIAVDHPLTPESIRRTLEACGYCGHPGHPGRECGCDVADGSGGFPCGCCPDLETFRSRRTTVTGQETRAPVVRHPGTKALPNCSHRMEAS
jgi:hypothetical protein